MPIDGHETMLEARLREPFVRGSTANEVCDRPGFALARNAWERDPKKYALIARDLFDLYSPGSIARNHGVSPETVRSIRNLYPELVQAGKLKLMANLEEASMLLSDRLIDEIESLDLAKVPAALASVVEKLSLLSGGATIRTEHVETRKNTISPEELRTLFQNLPNAEKS